MSNQTQNGEVILASKRVIDYSVRELCELVKSLKERNIRISMTLRIYSFDDDTIEGARLQISCDNVSYSANASTDINKVLNIDSLMAEACDSAAEVMQRQAIQAQEEAANTLLLAKAEKKKIFGLLGSIPTTEATITSLVDDCPL